MISPLFTLENFKTTPTEEMYDLYHHEVMSLIGVINAKDKAIQSSCGVVQKAELLASVVERVSRSIRRIYMADCLENVRADKGNAMGLLNFGREMGFLSLDQYVFYSDCVMAEYGAALRRLQ